MFPLALIPGEGRKDRSERDPAASRTWHQEQELEKRFAVTPGTTVFGGDLDRLERDFMREFHQRGVDLPPLDAVFSEFGGGRVGKRMQWLPSSSFEHFKDVDRNRARETVVGDAFNRNLSAYHMAAEAYREKQEAKATEMGSKVGENAKGINYCKIRNDNDGELELDSVKPQPTEVEHHDLEAHDNPHFPLPSEEPVIVRSVFNALENENDANDDQNYSSTCHHLVIDARKDYRPVLETVEGEDDTFEYDAYKQRPAEKGMLELRGLEYWENYENRKRLEDQLQYEDESYKMEMLQEGAMDTSEVEYSVNRVRKEVLLYFQAHPINEMIQESYVRIREITPSDGSERITFNPYERYEFDDVDANPPGTNHDNDEAVRRMRMDVDIPVQEARRLAQGMALDLVRIGSIHTDKSDRRVIALCRIGDHREHLREMLRFKLQKLGVQPPPTRSCVEVPFRGGTHPHAIRFKAVGIAKHLLQRHTVRIHLSDFGTPREGFPVLQCILDEVRRQCTALRAFHSAGRPRAGPDALFCDLHPTTGPSPKTAVRHPSPEALRRAAALYSLTEEKRIFFDDLREIGGARERGRYLAQLARGTAWAAKDDGLSLQRQRALKVRLGYLPKGNKELYAARGDVNIPAPFRASHPTSVGAWTNPVESNLDQAARGAAVLGKRATMPISEMHDRGETPENESVLDYFYYKASGYALEMGELKEAFGLKNNRRKPPPLAPGFATLGKGQSNDENPAFPRQNATK
ncbi:unnamed protein product [Phytomonas sp. Hart1]|nr:unnamed protein product [Phytomonas sp. Hart1]|eukprot:CCW71862.1 unnamed protein product [Phytomonas sp. isolate Hart1]